MKISINIFDERSIDQAIEKLTEYENSLDQKAEQLCERLAELGAWYAEWNFSGVEWTYSGDVAYSIDVKRTGENQYAIIAGGQAVLFLEFGAGVTLGYGHPLAAEMGMGPGTYPNGKGHWDDPHGWWYVDDGMKVHTYGNAPGMPMYNAAKDIRREILKVAREVFQT